MPRWWIRDYLTLYVIHRYKFTVAIPTNPLPCSNCLPCQLFSTMGSAGQSHKMDRYEVKVRWEESIHLSTGSLEIWLSCCVSETLCFTHAQRSRWNNPSLVRGLNEALCNALLVASWITNPLCLSPVAVRPIEASNWPFLFPHAPLSNPPSLPPSSHPPSPI